LGGEVLAGPFETAIGPMAALRDPFGAAFSVYELTPAG
jgi:predicted enzyme related to lactoylglutathione lyase